MCLLVLLYMVTSITQQPSLSNSHQKMIQTIYNTYVFAGITIYGHSDHAMVITVEFTSKNNFRPYITLMCLQVLPYMVTPIMQTTIIVEFTSKNDFGPYITYVFAGITIYGHSNHAMVITVEFTSKNNFRPYITLMCLRVLPYMVTLIMQPPSLLNSHQKMILDHI